MKNKRYVLIDTSGISHAAWHAYPEKTGKDGLDARVLHGVLSKVKRLEKLFDWDHLVFVLDNHEGSYYRKSIFPLYKANRPPQDEEFKRQNSELETQLNLLGYKTLKQIGVESDDLIGSLSTYIKNNNGLTMILSADKDLSQLVCETVWLLKPTKGHLSKESPFETIDSDGVFKKFGVYPNQIADWLALTGDISDNIPGIKGIGEKTATKLLNDFGNIENLLNNCSGLKPKIKEELSNSYHTLIMAKKLTSILMDIEIDINLLKAPTQTNLEKKINLINLKNIPPWLL